MKNREIGRREFIDNTGRAIGGAFLIDGMRNGVTEFLDSAKDYPVEDEVDKSASKETITASRFASQLKKEILLHEKKVGSGNIDELVLSLVNEMLTAPDIARRMGYDSSLHHQKGDAVIKDVLTAAAGGLVLKNGTLPENQIGTTMIGAGLLRTAAEAKADKVSRYEARIQTFADVVRPLARGEVLSNIESYIEVLRKAIHKLPDDLHALNAFQKLAVAIDILESIKEKASKIDTINS